MKRIVFITIIIVLIFSHNAVFADDNEIINNIYEQANLYELELYTSDYSFFEISGYTNIKDLILAIISGDYIFSFSDFFTFLKNILFDGIKENTDLITNLFLLGILCGLTQLMGNSFMNKEISEISFYAVYICTAVILTKIFFSTISTSSSLFNILINYMNVLLPILIMLLSLSGGVFSGGLISPSLIFIINIFSAVMKNIAIPLTTLSCMLNITLPVLKDINISYLTRLMKQTVLSVIGFLFIIFLGIMSMQSIAFSSADNVAAKTLKFATKSFIPIIGNFLSDSADTVFGFAYLIKNSVGLIATIILISLLSLPIMKILTSIICLKICSSLIQPITDERISKAIANVSSSLTTYFVCILICALMFFFLIGIITLLGNFSAG